MDNHQKSMKIARIDRHIARLLAGLAVDLRMESKRRTLVYFLSAGVLEQLVNPYPV
jgi:hypothetical protein